MHLMILRASLVLHRKVMTVHPYWQHSSNVEEKYQAYDKTIKYIEANPGCTYLSWIETGFFELFFKFGTEEPCHFTGLYGTDFSDYCIIEIPPYWHVIQQQNRLQSVFSIYVDW